MSEEQCMLEGCPKRAYAPSGTGQLCKDHFSDFVKWRRRKGSMSMFRKYNAMTMEERDSIVQDWGKTLAAG